MDNKVWLLYGIGIEEPIRQYDPDELTPVLFGIYSDLEHLKSEIPQLRVETEKDSLFRLN